MSDAAVSSGELLSVEVGEQETFVALLVSGRIEVDGDTRLAANTSGLTCGDIRGAVGSSTGVVRVRLRCPRVCSTTWSFSDIKLEQETHHGVWLGETPRSSIRKHCQYSLLEKFENAFDTALDFIPKHASVPREMVMCGQPSNGVHSCFFVLLLLLQRE